MYDNGVIKNEVENNYEEDVRYVKIDNIHFEVVSKYVGNVSLLDIIKDGIRRDIELGNY